MKKILKEINEIPNINQGGCGIVALAIHRKQKRGFFVKLFSGFFSNDCHVAINDGNNIIDSTGVHPVGSLNGYNRIEKTTEKGIIDAINNGQWDNSFDRKNIKKIEKITGVNLSDIR